jgi:hypothetical protein
MRHIAAKSQDLDRCLEFSSNNYKLLYIAASVSYPVNFVKKPESRTANAYTCRMFCFLKSGMTTIIYSCRPTEIARIRRQNGWRPVQSEPSARNLDLYRDFGFWQMNWSIEGSTYSVLVETIKRSLSILKKTLPNFRGIKDAACMRRSRLTSWPNISRPDASPASPMALRPAYDDNRWQRRRCYMSLLQGLRLFNSWRAALDQDRLIE